MFSLWPSYALFSSSPYIIRYPHAVDRLGSELVQLLSRGYHRARGNGVMNREVFIQSVIGEEFVEMPDMLVVPMFHAFNVEKTGHISLKEFLCAIAVLVSGKFSEKLRFTYFIMNTSGSGYLSKEELLSFLYLFAEPNQRIAAKDRAGHSWSVDRFADRLMSYSRQNNGGLRLDELTRALSQFEDICFLNWIPYVAERFLQLDDLVYTSFTKHHTHPSLATSSNPPISPDAYQYDDPCQSKSDVLLFSTIEIQPNEKKLISRSLFSLNENCYMTGVQLQQFLDSFFSIFPSEVLKKLFEILDIQDTGIVSVRDIFIGIACLCSPNLEKISKFCFDIFDTNGDGLVSMEQLTAIILYTHTQICDYHRGYIPGSPLQPSLSYTSMVRVARNLADAAYAFLFPSGNVQCNVSFEQYQQWIESYSIANRFLNRIFGIVQVGMGKACPTSKEDQRHFLAQIYTEFDPLNPGLPGEDVYLLPVSWWEQWLEYVQVPKNGKCRKCRNLRKMGPQKTKNHSPLSFQEEEDGDDDDDDGCSNSLTTLKGVDTAQLLVKDSTWQLRLNLNYKVDFLVVKYEVWKTLQYWYGSGPEIRRQIICCNGRFELELYPLLLHVHLLDGRLGSSFLDKSSSSSQLNNNSSSVSTVPEDVSTPRINSLSSIPTPTTNTLTSASKKGSPERISSSSAFSQSLQGSPSSHPNNLELVESQETDGCQEFVVGTLVFSKTTETSTVKEDILKVYGNNCELSHARIWHCLDGSQGWELMDDTTNRALMSLQFIDGHHVLLEICKDLSHWPKQSSLLTKTQEISSSSSSSLSSETEIIPGILGMYNLGNTCFMNSALQCLCHMPLLTEYFLRKEYLYDVNTSNPLGMNGLIAIAYGDLIAEMWNPNRRHVAVAPRRFKQTVGRFNPQFEGLQQQDAQELLSVVLSGLNEDLCRASVKPYIEQPDSNGRPDSDVAHEWWVNHIYRDPSVITALLCGQFKSLLRCLSCGFESARFEPFSVLQLPLPEPTDRVITLTLRFLKNRSPPLKMSIHVPKDDLVQKLVDQIALADYGCDCSAPSSRDLIVTTVNHGEITSIVSPFCSIQTIAESTHLVVYEVDSQKDFYDHLHEDHEDDFKMSIFRKGKKESSSLDDESTKKVVVVVRFQKHRFLRAQVIDQVVDQLKDSKDMRNSNQVLKEQEQDDDVHHDNVVAHHHHHPEETMDVILLDEPYHGIQMHGISIQRDIYALGSIVPVHVVFIHRRLELVPFYFANPFRKRCFFVPFVMRFMNHKTTGKELYAAVFQQMEWFLDENNNQDKNSPLPLYFSMIPLECAPPTQLYGFRLCRVNRRGLACSQCPWFSKCNGCQILENDSSLVFKEEENIAIDWDAGLLRLYNQQAVDFTQNHSSLSPDLSSTTKPNTIQECMETFSKEEQVIAFCSNCTAHANGNYTETKQLKSLNLWGMPPILVVQLKRFKYITPGNHYKLENVVKFPIEDFDLRSFLANAQNEDDSVPVAHDFDEKFNFPKFTLSRTSTTYDLYGVVNHSGVLGAGHYTSLVKHNDGWVSYDDCNFAKHKKENIGASNEVYLLFYVRKDVIHSSITEIFPRMPGAVPVDATSLREKMMDWQREHYDKQNHFVWKYLPASYTKLQTDKCSFM